MILWDPSNARKWSRVVDICWLLKKCYSIEDSSVYFTKLPLVSHKNKLNDGGGIHFLARTMHLLRVPVAFCCVTLTTKRSATYEWFRDLSSWCIYLKKKINVPYFQSLILSESSWTFYLFIYFF
jgi:hypothetical protein